MTDSRIFRQVLDAHFGRILFLSLRLPPSQIEALWGSELQEAQATGPWGRATLEIVKWQWVKALLPCHFALATHTKVSWQLCEGVVLKFAEIEERPT